MFLKYCFVLYIDLLKLYNSKDLDPDFSPHSLQNKVQFDIRYYLCRWANESSHAMTKEFFQLVYDPETQTTYVKKVRDELTKNHKETNNEVLTGFMPQFLDSTGHPHPLCPIRSFENYVNNLNENIPNLWQQPVKSFPKDITKPWYKSEALGHNTLEKFLGRLSDKKQFVRTLYQPLHKSDRWHQPYQSQFLCKTNHVHHWAQKYPIPDNLPEG